MPKSSAWKSLDVLMAGLLGAPLSSSRVPTTLIKLLRLSTKKCYLTAGVSFLWMTAAANLDHPRDLSIRTAIKNSNPTEISLSGITAGTDRRHVVDDRPFRRHQILIVIHLRQSEETRTEIVIEIEIAPGIRVVTGIEIGIETGIEIGTETVERTRDPVVIEIAEEEVHHREDPEEIDPPASLRQIE
jgi:hypothetical protein